MASQRQMQRQKEVGTVGPLDFVDLSFIKKIGKLFHDHDVSFLLWFDHFSGPREASVLFSMVGLFLFFNVVSKSYGNFSC